MKAQDILIEIATTSPTWDKQIKLIQEYGRNCAQQALNDAAENVKIGIESPSGRYFSQKPPFTDPDGDTISIDKESITQTEILTP